MLPAPPSGQRVRLRRGKAPSEGYLQMFRDNRCLEMEGRLNSEHPSNIGGAMCVMLERGEWKRLAWFANSLDSHEGSRKPPKGLCMERCIHREDL